MSVPSIPPELQAQLSSLAQPGNPETFIPFLQSSTNPPNPDNLAHLATFLYTDALALPPARALHIQLTSALLTLPPNILAPLAERILAVHASSPRSFAFETPLIPLRERLAALHETSGDYDAAANVLTTMPFDTLAALPDHALLRCNLRIATLFVRARRADRADLFLNRAASQLPLCTDPALRAQHRRIHAETLHLKGRFADAAAKYHQLSHTAGSGDALHRASVCAILAPAGPRRSRILAILYADERVRALDVFPLLESIHMGRLLTQPQVAAFRGVLGDGAGEGVLDRAVVEHNLLAASRLYADVGFRELGDLLGISSQEAETTAAKMIYEGRMKATIDQVEGVLRFAIGGKTVLIERWDAHIAGLCGAVDDAVEAILNRFPQFASHLDG